MKIKFLILNIISLSMIILFVSCSNDDDSLDGNLESTQQSIVTADAALIVLGANDLTDNLTLDIVIPENEYGLSNTEPLLLLPFYKPADVGSETWLPIPNVQIEKNLKTYYSRDNGLQLILIAEKFDSSLPYGIKLEFKELNVIAIKPSSLLGLTRNDLDTRNYNELVDHFGLKK